VCTPCQAVADILCGRGVTDIQAAGAPVGMVKRQRTPEGTLEENETENAAKRRCSGHGGTICGAAGAVERSADTHGLRAAFTGRGGPCLIEFWGTEGVFMPGRRYFSVEYAPWFGAWGADAVERTVRGVLPPGTAVYGILRAENNGGSWMRIVSLLVDFGGVPLRSCFRLDGSLFRVGSSRAVVGCMSREGSHGGGGRARLSADIGRVWANQRRLDGARGLVAVFGAPIVIKL
jgi:hypothetical protein